jgi:hypothetical protein
MHSFHPSRGRVLFEVFCAMTLAASFAIGWTQTGASALLGAAAVAVLYSIVHAFDLNRRVPAVTAEVPAAEPAPPLAFAVPEVQASIDEEPKATKPKRPRKKKAVADVAAEASGFEIQAADRVADIAEPMAKPEILADHPEPAVELPEVPMQIPGADDAEEDYHPHVTPLFEPQPMVRQLRTFGRKAG